MAQTSWPFENVDTTEVQFSQWARHINEGIRPNFANELEVFADDSGLNVKVKSGQAMVRGHYYDSTAEETLTITTPDATNPRIDSVVLELDIVANSILLKVVAGTPDASPVAPTLTQSEDGNVYQLLLANVDVAAGVFSIESGDVTDLRNLMSSPVNDIITTEGDLIVGDSNGKATRLPVGSADQVLTSDGTTVSFQDAGGGGPQTFVNLPFEELLTIDVDFPANSLVRFSVITTVSDPFEVSLFDSSNTEIDTITLDTDNPFTYFTNATAISTLVVTNNVVNENAILVFSQPTEAIDAPVISQFSITSTQSVTISTPHTVYVFGGGGGGGGSTNAGAAGGGSGFFATGTLAAGTYTATIGAGGDGGDTSPTAGSAGGQSSINGITANGGSGGHEGSGPDRDGGDGGSGGGGASSSTVDFAEGGRNGGNGQDENLGSGGLGSGVTLPQTNIAEIVLIKSGAETVDAGFPGGLYEGGAGGQKRTRTGQSSTFNGGGGGGSNDAAGGPARGGGNGGDGFILFVEE